MKEIKLGKYAAEIELKILEYANTKPSIDFEGLTNKFQVNPHTGRSFAHPDEDWNHITDWRLVSAVDDLVRYGLLADEGTYRITQKGIRYLSFLKE